MLAFMTDGARGGDGAASLSVLFVGGPTAVLELGGLRLLTDPTFDQPGDYPLGGGRSLVKTESAPVGPEDIGAIDAVLLSHDQHPDNLDRSGRDLLARVPVVLTTAAAVDRLGGVARNQPAWESTELARPDGGSLRITWVPAQHGPDGSRDLVGEVTGFVLSGDGVPTVYVSGDNASLDVVAQVADRFAPVDVAVLFAGAARTALLGDANLTLDSDDAAEAARRLAATHVLPLHFRGWAHFTQGPDTLRASFARAGLADRLTLLEPGQSVRLPV